jgi:hypothetical protein
MKEFLTSDPVMCLLSCLGLGFWLWAWTLSRGKKASTYDWITLASTILRIFCGLLLVEASLDKLGDAARFSQSLANYKIVPSLWGGLCFRSELCASSGDRIKLQLF